MTVWSRTVAVIFGSLFLFGCSDGNGDYQANPPDPGPVLEQILLLPESAEVPAGLQVEYTATGVYSDGSEQNLTDSVSWSSSVEDIASIDPSGVATGLAPGVTDISALLDDVTGSTALTVSDAEVVSLGIFPPAASLQKGTTQDYRAFAIYTDGRLENVTFAAQWSLADDSGILAPYEPLLTKGLNALDDFATAIAVDVGSDTLLVSLPAQEEVSAAATTDTAGISQVVVTDSELLTLRINPRSATILDASSRQYQATGLYADGTTADLTKVVIWATDNPAAATVSNQPGERGLVRGVAAGTANITAIFQNRKDETDVTVLASGGLNPVTKLDVFPPLQSLNVGSAQQYSAIAYLADGTAIDVTADALWASSLEEVALISNAPATVGLAVATSAGVTSIQAEYEGFDGSSSLEVRSPGEGELQQIVVEPATSVLQNFTSQQFRAFGLYDDGSRRDITGDVVWGSEDEAVIQVSNSIDLGKGLGLALATGDTRVTATQAVPDAQVQGTATVSVIDAAGLPALIVVDPPTAISFVGDNQQFSATLVLENGQSENVSDNVTWSVTDSAVAQVDDNGLATAEAEGATNIVATLSIAGVPISGSALYTVQAMTIEEILVDPPLANIIVGSTQAYTARAVLSDGRVVDVSQAVSWSSSNSAVAPINLDGVAFASAPGSTTIAALLTLEGGSYQGTALLSVAPAPVTVTSIVVSPKSASVFTNGRQQFTATALLSNGTQVDVSNDSSWSTTDTAIAHVDSSGLATGLSAGSTEVQARFLSAGITYSDSASLQVNSPQPVSIEVLPPVAALVVDSTLQYTALAQLNDGSEVDVSGQVSWVSADPLIAQIAPGGLATALAQGNTLISAVLDVEGTPVGGDAELQVKPLPLELLNLQVEPVAAEILIGGGQQYRAIASFSDGSSQDVTGQSSWTSSDASIAQVNEAALATGLAEGVVQISALYVYQEQNASAAGQLSVLAPVAVEELIVDPPLQTVSIGEKTQYTARLVLSNGQTVDVTNDSNWVSAAPGIASVNPGNGRATGESAGETSIEASISVADQLYTNSASIEVLAPDPEVLEILVEPASANILVGGTQQYTALAVYSDNTVQDISQLVSWASSDDSLAWVDSAGLATALAAGKVDITATWIDQGQSYSNSGRLSIAAPDITVTGIEVSPATAEQLVGGKQQYTATAFLSDGSSRDVTAQTLWQSSDSLVANISAAGRATALSPGATDIVGTYTDADGSYMDSALFTVVAAPVTVEQLVVDPPTASVLIEGVQQFTATALLSDGSSQDVTDLASWQSTATDIAHVDGQGLATGLAAGKSDIQATFSYGGQTVSDAGRLTVQAPVVEIEEIQVIPPVADILVGDKLQYTAIAVLSNGSQVDVTNEASWLSSDSSVAQLNDAGRATGISAGQVTVTASVVYQGETSQGVAQLEVKAAEISIDELVVEPATAEVLIDGTQQFRAYVLLSDGSRHEVTQTASWRSSDDQLAAVDPQGLATGLAEGKVEITATYLYQGQSYSDAGRLTIKAPQVGIDSLRVEPAFAEVLIGGTQQYRAIALLSDGTQLDVTRDVSWSSSNDAIAQVSATGLATGLTAGTIAVTAQLDYAGELYSDSGDLQVNSPAVSVSEIVVEPPSAEVVVESTARYTAVAILSNGDEIPVTDEATWTTADTAIAVVTAPGVVEGIDAGTTDVIATLVYLEASFSDSARVKVQPPTVTVDELVVTPAAAEILVDGKLQYTATAILSDGSEIDVTRDSSWSSSDDAIAAISVEARATGIAPGAATITAQFEYQGNSVSDSAQLTVKPPAVTVDELVVEPAQATIEAETTQQYTATAILSDGDIVDVSNEVVWRSLNTAIADIDSTGLAIGLAEGDTQIEASLLYNGVTSTDNAELRVKPAPVVAEDLVVDPLQAELVEGQSQQFSATVYYSDDSSGDVTDEASWTSSDTSVAKVNGQGLAQTLAPGTSQISATFDGLTTSGELDVTARVAVELQVVPPSVTDPAGTKGPLLALARYSDDSVEVVSALASWSTGDPALVAIEQQAGAKAVVYELRAVGNTTITASLDGLASTVPAEITPPVLQTIEVSPALVSTPAGLLVKFTATGFYGDGSSADLTDEAAWSSSDDSVAVIVSPGVAESLTAGVADISAEHEGVEGVARYSVTEAEISSLVVTPPSFTDPAGTSTQFQARAIYTDGSDRVVTSQADWSSSNIDVAAVQTAGDESPGLTSLLVPGSAIITAQLQGAEDSAELLVSDPVIVEINLQPYDDTAPSLSKLQFVATAIYSDQSTANVTAEASWASDSRLQAVAGLAGEVYTLTPGLANISASLDGVSGTAPLTVVPAQVIDLQVEPGSVEGPAGSSLRLRATAFYDNGLSVDVTRRSSWQSADKTVAVVRASGAQAGLSGLLSEGQTTITANFSGVVREVPVTVTPAQLLELFIQPEDPSVPLGRSQQFEAWGVYSDGSQGPLFEQGRAGLLRSLTDSVTWTSSDDDIASINTTGLAQSVAVGTTSIGAAYQGLSTSTGMEVTAATITQLVITPAFNEGPAGTESQLKATATYSDNSQRDVTRDVEWSTANSAVATVGPAGKLSFLAEGTTTIFGKLQGAPTAEAEARTTPALLETIVLTPDPLSLRVGDSGQMLATGTYSDGSTADVTDEADWTTGDPGIATVDAGGLVSGVAEGAARVKASIAEVAGTADVNVRPATLTSIQIEPGAVDAPAGTEGRLRATGYYSDGSQQDLTAVATWDSADEAVAVVGNGDVYGGELKLKATGTTEVGAALGAVSNKITVKVTAAILESIDVQPAVASIPRGTQQQYTATGEYSDGSYRQLNDDPGLIWTSTEPQVASIDSDGLATAVAVDPEINGDSTNIIATLDVVKSPAAKLTVTAPVPESLTVTPAGLAEPAGTTGQLKATVTYSDSSQEDVTAESGWKSSDPATVLVYNGADAGRIDFKQAGSATVTALFQEVPGSTDVQVTAPILQAIVVTPAAESVAKGVPVRYSADGIYSDGTTSLLSDDVAWRSTATDVATIDAVTGLASTVGVGEADIIAAFEELEGKARLEVTPAELLGLQISPAAPVTLLSGQKQQYRAEARYSDGSSGDVTEQVTWAVQPSSLASFVDPQQAPGLLEAQSQGDGLVLAYMRQSGEELTGRLAVASVELTVDAVTLESVEINTGYSNDGSIEMRVGTQQAWTAIARLSNGDTPDITSTAVWTSFRPAVVDVSVDENADIANVSAISQGAATVRIYYVDPVNAGLPFTDSISVTTTPPALLGVDVYPDSVVATEGAELQFLAIASYEGGGKDLVTYQADWLSSDTEVVAVSATGAAEALAAGSAVVTAAFGGKSGDASMQVTGRVLESITVEPGNLSLGPAGSRAYQAFARYSDDTLDEITADANWASSDTSVATVVNTNNGANPRGYVSARGPGETSITATLDGVSGSGSLTVTASCEAASPNGKPDSVRVEPDDASLPVGDELQYTLIGEFPDDCQEDLTDSGNTNWKIDDKNVVDFVDKQGSPGLVVAVGEGTTEVEGKFKDVRDSATVTVFANSQGCDDIDQNELPDYIYIVESAKISEGESFQFEARGVWRGGECDLDITDSPFLQWRNLDGGEQICPIDGTGLAAGVSKGKTDIEAAYNGGRSDRKECQVQK
ncbi:MAG: Ig-like domain-containing protein [Halieaceae bacterium]